MLRSSGVRVRRMGREGSGGVGTLRLPRTAPVVTALGVLVGQACGESPTTSRRAWVSLVNSKLSAIDSRSSEWRKACVAIGVKDQLTEEEIVSIVRNARTEALGKCWSLPYTIRDGLYELWDLTGHCEFADIPSDQLVRRAAEVTGRYRRLLKTFGDRPVTEVYLKGLDQTVELLQTDYCLPALNVIQEKIAFAARVGHPRRSSRLPPPKPGREVIYREMKTWFAENRSSLVWDPSHQAFVRNRRPRMFVLPRGITSRWAKLTVDTSSMKQVTTFPWAPSTRKGN